jgi:hypothetical protein
MKLKIKYFRHGHRIPFETAAVHPDAVRILGGSRLDLWRLCTVAEGRRPAAIRPGDRAEVGGYVFRFHLSCKGTLFAMIEEHKVPVAR